MGSGIHKNKDNNMYNKSQKSFIHSNLLIYSNKIEHWNIKTSMITINSSQQAQEISMIEITSYSTSFERQNSQTFQNKCNTN